jgi:arylformamidase
MKRRIHDISQPVGERTAVWPGDRPFELGWTMSRGRGDSVNVAEIMLSVHTGTHVDGPFHYTDEAPAIGAIALEPFIGDALVVDAVGAAVIDERALDGVPLDGVRRVLFRTRPRVDASTFPERFAHIAPSLADRLAAAGVRLVGTDSPSVDPPDSKTLEAHVALARHDIAILENLVLEDVRPGRYLLIALPLKLAEADSSPVRAVLIEGTDA